ncbi:MAG: OPT family oligopeptide transporter [Planctomycetota bacterium]
MSQPTSSQSAEPSGSAPPPPFQPFVPAGAQLTELTLRGVAVGSVLGIVFAASSVYLGLKVGLTVSASIPVAVLSITLFRWLERALKLRPASILENNIVQTTGSAGESIAAGVAFTLPSLLLMGFDMEISRILLVALMGGLIGVLMMIPLRQSLMVKEHGKLTYPEGTACAEVLIVGERGGTSAKLVFTGFFCGLAYSTMNLILKLWADASSFALGFWGKLKGATLGFEVSPTMLGVGYIIGPRTSCNMFAGGALAFLVLVPLVHLFGDSASVPLLGANKLVRDMSAGEIRNAYILYIGAGAVATGGFIALARAVPTIFSAFFRAMGSMRSHGVAGGGVRTERDLPMSIVIGGSIALIVAIWCAPILNINLLSAVLILLFGFFFVTVSSRITGEIGSSSNPISGMTVATLLITCGLFVAVGWTGVEFKAMALSTAALVCVAASNGGTISQDLKTGFLVGATPRHQQVAIMFGVVTSALLVGWLLWFLNDTHVTYPAVSYPNYKATVLAQNGMADGPDGKPYAIHYIAEDEKLTGGVPRGKYLVESDGTLAFRADPGVCGTYGKKLVAATGENRRVLPPAAVPADAPVELGIDRKPYRVVTETRDGRDVSYLVGENNEIIYEIEPKTKFDAPKAQLFRLIIDGTLGGELPWGLVLAGVFLAIMAELLGVSALPFAVGLYLPIYTSGGVLVGGLVRWLVDRIRRGPKSAEAEYSPGVLMASGLIAGGAIAGVLQSGVEALDLSNQVSVLHHLENVEQGSPGIGESLRSGITNLLNNGSWWPLLPFLLLALILLWQGTRARPMENHRGDVR